MATNAPDRPPAPPKKSSPLRRGRGTKGRAPILPMRDTVAFPGMVVPLFVGRAASIAAVKQAMADDEILCIVAQRTNNDDISADNLYAVGCTGKVLQFLPLPDGTVKILVDIQARVHLTTILPGLPMMAEYQIMVTKNLDDPEMEGINRALLQEFEDYVHMTKKIPPELFMKIQDLSGPELVADAILAVVPMTMEEKQEFLESEDVLMRQALLFDFLEKGIETLKVDQKVRHRVKRQMEKNQREYYLNEQIKAIQKELSDTEDGASEFDVLEKAIATRGLSKEAQEKAKSELKKLKSMGPMSAEASMVRTYLDWLIYMPWKKKTALKHDLDKAEKLLDAQHYGLEKVKERILEHLAVHQRVGKVPGQILCLVGPPGVGKTSLGKSIAEATGRNFQRISLGGVRDEAEIRGHRRTYIGAQPGKILQNIKKAGSTNPLILLDEIEKLGSDWRGDPTSALLEVLDPEQNATFGDHYLEVPYDLSNVMFITTANTLSMPQPLLDRMEIIRLSGYTEDEKLQIAKRHLLPKEYKRHGLKPQELTVTDAALLLIIQRYTQESGVRNLERQIAKICRKSVRRFVQKTATTLTVDAHNLHDFLGVEKYHHQVAEEQDSIGVATGLAWTSVGGEILSIEAVKVPGKGLVKATGKLGEVMQESVQAAHSFVKAHYQELGISAKLLETTDIHVHVPEGATPKDGPSAGTAICTALVSLLTDNPVRRTVAMTGEITLRGRVLAIGGLKEKALAAQRSGITTILIPQDNLKDLADLPESCTQAIAFKPVRYALEVLELALVRPLVPLTSPTEGAESAASTENSVAKTHQPTVH